jgi:D-alanine-D-alanine ligase
MEQSEIDRHACHVAVLMGGPSAERDVSLQSGRNVARALAAAGFRVTAVDVPGPDFELPADTDVAFLALHGPFGEDGTVQQLLEQRELPYTGSGPEASARALDKMLAKVAFAGAGLRIARHTVVDAAHRNGYGTLRYPVVVKPALQGSSFGISIAPNPAAVARACEAAFAFDTVVLVEEYVAGREFTVGVLGDQALPVVEIRTQHAFFDLAAKYTPGEAEELVPAPIDAVTTARLQAVGLRAHACLGCRDLSRTDVILSEAGELVVLEVNTLPGMTENSLFPKAARAAGLEMPALCQRLVEQALARVPVAH